MRKIVVLSGGLDSTVLLAECVAECGKDNIKAISVNYGQRHVRELDAARKIATMFDVEHKVVDLSALRPLLNGSSQTSDIPVPHGHYAEENMKLTVVPNRNMLLLAVAGCFAISVKADAIAYAAHAGDHAIYPDCREEFVAPLAEALRNADWHIVELERPFLQMTKSDIVKLGVKLNASSVLASSYSCYEGKELHCGLCGTCQERRVAFRDAGFPDPTEYNPEGIAKLPDVQLQS